MVKCKICNSKKSLDIQDEELVCFDCGASFGLEYLGMYEEGSDVRLDEGFEPSKWVKKHLDALNKN